MEGSKRTVKFSNMHNFSL